LDSSESSFVRLAESSEKHDCDESGREEGAHVSVEIENGRDAGGAVNESEKVESKKLSMSNGSSGAEMEEAAEGADDSEKQMLGVAEAEVMLESSLRISSNVLTRPSFFTKSSSLRSGRMLDSDDVMDEVEGDLNKFGDG
jgi:hypothetical protein